MPKITIDNFMGGLGPYYYISNTPGVRERISPPNSFSGAATVVDPNYHVGYLFPGREATLLTNVEVVGGVIARFVVDDGNRLVYGIEKGTKLHQIDIPSDTIINNAAFPHIIVPHASHSGAEGKDLIMYQVNGTRRLFYSWTDNVDGDVGIFDLSASFDDDFMSTVPAGAGILGKFPHPMWVGPNNLLYIGDGAAIHKFDGTITGGANGTFTANAITLLKDFVIKDVVDWKNKAWVLAEKTTSGTGTADATIKKECRVFIWNYVSVQTGNLTGFDEIIPLDGFISVSKIAVYEGVPVVFGINDGLRGEMKKWNGSEFEPEKEIAIGEIPDLGGVDIYKNMLIWCGSGGAIMTYGSQNLRLYPKALNRIGKIGNDCGALIYTQSKYFVSGNTNQIFKFDPYSGTNSYTGARWVSNIYEFDGRVRIREVRFFYFRPMVNSTANKMNISVYLNRLDIPAFFGTISYNQDGEAGYKSFSIPQNSVRLVAVDFNWDQDEVNTMIMPSKIEIFYDELE